MLHDVTLQLLLGHVSIVLSRQHDCVYSDRSDIAIVVQVLDRHLKWLI